MYSETYRKELEKKIENYARVNLLSPKQTKKLIKLDYDAAFLEDKISECLQNPDIPYLQKMFLPNIEYYNLSPKSLVDIDVFNSVAAGDIIGSKCEFTEHDYDGVNPDDIVSSHSTYTDDTVLSYATLAAIRKSPRRPNFRKAYLSAYKNFPDAGFGSSFIRWANGDIPNREGYGSFANGSAMRVAVIGCCYKNVKDVIKNAINSAIVTHNHQDGIKGAVITAVVIWLAKNKCSKKEIREYVERFYHLEDEDKAFLFNKESYFDLSTDLDTVSNAVSKTSIFCNYAVPFAIKCFLETNSYKECMTEILRHYGDSDTICAIAGGICYAYYDKMDLSQDDTRAVNDIINNFLSKCFS